MTSKQFMKQQKCWNGVEIVKSSKIPFFPQILEVHEKLDQASE